MAKEVLSMDKTYAREEIQKLKQQLRHAGDEDKRSSIRVQLGKAYEAEGAYFRARWQYKKAGDDRAFAESYEHQGNWAGAADAWSRARAKTSNEGIEKCKRVIEDVKKLGNKSTWWYANPKELVEIAEHEIALHKKRIARGEGDEEIPSLMNAVTGEAYVPKALEEEVDEDDEDEDDEDDIGSRVTKGFLRKAAGLPPWTVLFVGIMITILSAINITGFAILNSIEIKINYLAISGTLLIIIGILSLKS